MGAPEILGVEPRNGPACDAFRVAAAVDRVYRIMWRCIANAYILIEELPLQTGVIGAGVGVIVVVGGAVVVRIGDYAAAEPARNGSAGIEVGIAPWFEPPAD